ncbi:MAG TPA: cytochrome b/b6 domain-containing protein [Steroidobacter sp.]|jgi:cytochrome b|nr:cytochrome b/b6 domain-containing protein [Steroidobacter sp.]
MSNETVVRRRVWDLPTRVFHWALAFSFFGAYLLAESERVRHLHVMFGYTVLALTLFRLLWGFIGTRYARFNSFAFGPRAVFGHLRGLVRREVPEHVGHTPAGSWAIWLMLLLAPITAFTGWFNFNEIGGEGMEEVHEIVANVWLLMVLIHVAGVIVSTVVERQNLARSMITGYKALAGVSENVRNAAVVGVLMLTGIVGFWAATMLSGGALVLPAGTDSTHAAHASHAKRLSLHEHSVDD